MSIKNVSSISLSMLVLVACGGSGNPTAVEESENDGQTEVLSGRFLDSAVTGLQYDTESQSARTGPDGQFNYLAGENVVFSIGSIELPSVPARSLMTPLDVFSTDDIGDVRVINLVRLLQTLDVDADAENGISIAEDAHTSGTGLLVSFSSEQFNAQVSNLVANSGSTSVSLIDGENALDHFQSTLVAEGLVQAPPQDIGMDIDTSANTSDHPKVGSSSSFSTLFHDVSGTLTVIDDRTLEISNFVYDGEGPSVYFYTGTDGQYSSASGGMRIGPLLNGRRYSNETLRLTLPDGVTLDDFNGVSVWCDIFAVDFGSATVN